MQCNSRLKLIKEKLKSVKILKMIFLHGLLLFLLRVISVLRTSHSDVL